MRNQLRLTVLSAFVRSKLHRKKKVWEFPVPSRDVTTKLSLGGNNDVITELFLPRGSLVSDIPAGDGKLVNLFLRCTIMNHASFWTGQQALEDFQLARAIRKFYAAYDHLTLIGIGKTPAANKSTFIIG
jgi:hypothetical protein